MAILKYEDAKTGLHIIGFAKVMGDIRDGALNVITFFCITIVITAMLVWLYSQSFLFSVLPMGCSLAAVAWQLARRCHRLEAQRCARALHVPPQARV